MITRHDIDREETEEERDTRFVILLVIIAWFIIIFGGITIYILITILTALQT